MELPRLEIIWQEYREQGLSVVSVQTNEDYERGHAFIEQEGLTFHFLDKEEDKDVFYDLYRGEGNPTTLIIDEDGRVVSYHLGFSKGDEVRLENEIKQLLGIM